MHRSPYERQTGGFVVHVKDCYVWAEIQYLDSSTDYRECIRLGHVPALSAELTTEDERTRHRFESIAVLTFVAVFASILLVLIVR